MDARYVGRRWIQPVLSFIPTLAGVAAVAMMVNAVLYPIAGRVLAIQYLGSMLVAAAVWLYTGSTLLGVLSWLLPLTVFVVGIAPLLPPQLAIAGYAAGVVWLVLISCTRRASEAWNSLLRRFERWIVVASLPPIERRFYRDFLEAYASAREQRAREPSNRIQLARLQHEHVRDLERLEAPNLDWQRARLAALRLARQYLDVLEGRAISDQAHFDNLVEERDEALRAIMARRSPVWRVLSWRLRTAA